MRSNYRDEQGSTNPVLTLAILLSMGILAYLVVDASNPNDPATMSLSSIYTTWLGWSWWAKGLSVIGPVAMLLIGSKLDSHSGFTKLPTDDEEDL